MDDTQRIVKCGALSLHTPGGFFKKRWHNKYLVLYDGSKSGVKRLELFDSEIKFKKQNPAKIIPLVDCVRVVTCQRHKTTYTFEVRTSDQFYLLAGQSFQDMNDWVNCLRLVAFGQQQQRPTVVQPTQLRPSQQQVPNNNSNNNNNTKRQNAAAALGANNNNSQMVDILLEKRGPIASAGASTLTSSTATAALGASPPVASGPLPKKLPAGQSTPADCSAQKQHAHDELTGASSRITTASQAAAAAASALAKTRQRQPSLLGACKPQPPTDSPFIQQQQTTSCTTDLLNCIVSSSAMGQLDTLTPSVRGQLIATASGKLGGAMRSQVASAPAAATSATKPISIQATLDEEEENMLYCSIEDNPSEHNYRVKVIETELSLRCQLKCYQLTAPLTISQQYEQIGNFNAQSGAYNGPKGASGQDLGQQVTFYQLIIGPQELTLLNDYAISSQKLLQAQTSHGLVQQQGLWSWPYQCIRRYGFDKDNCFMFEAGRKCTSGPGQFIVQTPKAYNIYQDVVKFVNELRSLSTTQQDGIVGITSKTNSQAATTTADQNQKSITQIPVTWSPAINSTSSTDLAALVAIPNSATDLRQHFFNTLRQMDTLSSGIQQSTDDNFKVPNSNTNDNTTLPTSSSTSTTSTTLPRSQPPTTIASEPAETSNRGHTNITTTSTTCRQLATSSPDSVDTQPSSGVESSLASSRGGISSKTGTNTGVAAVDKQQKCDLSEETDESGYDQGDDSVDSGNPRRLKSLRQPSSTSGGAVIRKRGQDAIDESSMSSSSSTNSSDGSPGHSVSRRSLGSVVPPRTQNGLSNGQGSNNRRAPLISTGAKQYHPTGGLRAQQASTQKPEEGPVSAKTIVVKGRQSGLTPGQSLKSEQPTQKNLNRMHNLLLSDCLDRADDFETSLIRDVYSEITKLHAEFAITNSHSTEDSMSSSSSSERLAQDEYGANDSDSGSGGGGGGANGLAQCEPMYSNLRFPRAKSGPSQRMQRDAELPAESARKRRGESGSYYQSHQQQQQDQMYQHHQYQRDQNHQRNYSQNNNHHPQQDNYSSLSRPIYSGVLNPIPECGELQSTAATGYQHHQTEGLRSSSCRQGSAGRLADANGSYKSDMIRQRQNDAKQQQVPPGSSSQLLKSRLPTNHYLINDVQYAKISKNVCSKY